MISDLIEYGANVNQRNLDNCSALSCSLINKNMNIIRLLLANGAEMTKIDKEYAEKFFKKVPEKYEELKKLYI
jgi:ankyrin repeat protein